MDEQQKTKILLVEDQGLIALSTQANLSRLGYDVAVVINGESAVHQIHSNHEYDLILMDIELGEGMSGIDAAREIISKKDIPVVFVSSHTEADIIASTDLITSYGYIVKNSNMFVYDASIKMALKLFREKQNTKRVESILKTAIDQMHNAIFISDEHGDVVYANRPFLLMQGYPVDDTGLKRLADLSKHIDIFDKSGNLISVKQWPNAVALQGIVCHKEPFFIKKKFSSEIVTSECSYGPIKGQDHKIIGSYVQISKVALSSDSSVLDKVKKSVKDDFELPGYDAEA